MSVSFYALSYRTLSTVSSSGTVELGLTSELLTWRMRRVFDIQDSFMYVLVYLGLLLEIVLCI